MTLMVQQGFFEDLAAGAVTSGADVRGMLVMTNTTCDTEQNMSNLSDFTDIDEADGVGYVQDAITNVTVTWDAVNFRLEIDGDNLDFTTAGTLDACTRSLAGIQWFRYVDGTLANDVPWFFSDSGGFPKTPAGGGATATIDTEGLLQIEQV